MWRAYLHQTIKDRDLLFAAFCRVLDSVTGLFDLLSGVFYCLINLLAGVFC